MNYAVSQASVLHTRCVKHPQPVPGTARQRSRRNIGLGQSNVGQRCSEGTRASKPLRGTVCPAHHVASHPSARASAPGVTCQTRWNVILRSRCFGWRCQRPAGLGEAGAESKGAHHGSPHAPLHSAVLPPEVRIAVEGAAG